MVLFLLMLLRNGFLFLGGCSVLVCLIRLFVENRVQVGKVEKDAKDESESFKRGGDEDGVGPSDRVENFGEIRCHLGGEEEVFDASADRVRGVVVGESLKSGGDGDHHGLDVDMDRIVKEIFGCYTYNGYGAGEVSEDNGDEGEEKNLVQEDGGKVVAGEVVIGSVMRQERSCAMEAWLGGASVALKSVGPVRESGVDDESERLMEDDHEKEELEEADCIGNERLAQDDSEDKRLVEDEGESKLLIGDDNEKKTLADDEDDCQKVFEDGNEKETLADDEDENKDLSDDHSDTNKGLVEDDHANKQLAEEKGDGFGHDDDWEGIERTELEKRFGAAVAYVGCKETVERVSKLSNYVQMQLYGLHKVATQGPCSVPQPKIFQVSARANWNAWRQLGDMSPELAMEKYTDLLAENVPTWNADDSHGASGTTRRH